MTKGMITTIQRFSLHDGPGIRTTVFFKGCNMHCLWCHNPETIDLQPQLHVYPSKCIHCGACALVCPTGARTMVDGRLVYTRALCTNRGDCVSECFTGAIALSGKEVSVSEVMAEILQDKPYYSRSGGGVTLSGGEVLQQPEFARAILEACRAEGIATAIETNLNADFRIISPLLPCLDLVMADLKLEDDTAHIKWTGASNQRVIDNIRLLDQAGIPMILRTPVIPGANDFDDEIRMIASFVSSVKSVLYYELLNFNPLGDSKYASLDMENIFADARPLPDDRMEELAAIARRFGLDVQVR